MVGVRFSPVEVAYKSIDDTPVIELYGKTNEGKHYFTAMCATERKLVHLIYAVWKRGTPFEKRL